MRDRDTTSESCIYIFIIILINCLTVMSIHKTSMGLHMEGGTSPSLTLPLLWLYSYTSIIPWLFSHCSLPPPFQHNPDDYCYCINYTLVLLPWMNEWKACCLGCLHHHHERQSSQKHGKRTLSYKSQKLIQSNYNILAAHVH